MRILRLRLRHYRGTAEREVRFPPTGVTVVSGPNEIGKSSLAEAIDLLFDELDSTTKQRVRDVQPVDRDAGAEVEIELETGPYAFTYAKRFQRKARTELSVTRPRVENWTGREAHQRVREILAETLDTDLWRALRVQQGESLGQAAWRGHAGLAAALDRAAGTLPSERTDAERETSLLEAAEQEHARYFTKTGRPKRALARAQEEAESRRAEEEAARRDLEALEDDVARAEELRALREAREREARDAEEALREQEERFAPIEALREELATLRARRDAALAEEREAAQTARQRGQLVSAHAAAEADLAQRAEEIEHGEPALLGARAELEHAERALAQAREAHAQAEQHAAAHRDDLAFHHARRELLALEERSRRGAELRAAIAATAEARGDERIDEAAVRGLREAERAVERARTRVESEGPRVELVPQVELEVSVDGHARRLSAGETLEARVAESLLLSVPGLGDLRVVAGSGAAERVKALEQARTRLRERCAELGVADHADAVRRLAARDEAERRRIDLEGQLARLEEGQPEAEAEARIRELRRRTREHELARGALLPLPHDADEAADRLAESEAALARSRQTLEATERRRDALRTRHQRLADQHRDTAVRLELAQRSFGDLDERLATARREANDETLREASTRHGARAREIEATVREAAERLAALEPEAGEARLEEARRHRERCRRDLDRVREEATRIAARLELRGEAGLYERVETAAAEADRAEHAAKSLARRAAAARRLWQTLCEERDAAREGYAVPLARRIEEFGALVFGESFAVELDDELRVARRIQDGLSLRFDQLSAGAREQIALLARLAVATLVAPDGGAPLIVDDALGHSDPERLQRIGRAISAAAPDVQILVLTCTPERYRHVESAHVVQLG